MSKLDETETTTQKITPPCGLRTMPKKQQNFIRLFSKTQIIDITHYGESAAEVSGRPKEV